MPNMKIEYKSHFEFTKKNRSTSGIVRKWSKEMLSLLRNVPRRQELFDFTFGGNMALDSVLGPFIGHTTASSVKIWIQWIPGEISSEGHAITFSVCTPEGASCLASKTLTLTQEAFWAGCAEFSGLQPNTTYFYRISDSTGTDCLEVNGKESLRLHQTDLHFTTLPAAEEMIERLDFLLLSCHNPDAGRDIKNPNSDGFEVWSEIPRILGENPNIRFALLGGDQVYLDGAAREAFGKNAEARKAAILSAYRAHWDHHHYRKVLCSLPSYLMWDDHDIVDGWGSEESSFVSSSSSEFKSEWNEWFESARQAFRHMQASRNPDTFELHLGGPFDTCFRVGSCGFVLADLRSNRNVRLKQIWLEEQFTRVKMWIESQTNLETLFFLTPVVFAHGDPKTEEAIGRGWPFLLKIVDRFRTAGKFLDLINKWDKNIGDLRDDLNDAWFSEPNAQSAEEVLNFLFDLQNKVDPINVVILSGDIHTSGCSNIYSDSSGHREGSIIPQIVSSPVAYSPFHWIGEAIYRSRTKTVRLSPNSKFKAQISHHFAHRCATVVSLRKLGSEKQLKVKFYLEGFEEPTSVVFDLLRSSHREQLAWSNGGVPGTTAKS